MNDAGVESGRRVEFDSHGETIVGRLFAAAIGDGAAPGVAILGPMTFQKEQAPLQYARRFAELGYAALIFDTRYRGESGGHPRCYESPMAKVEDMLAAVRFLAERPEVDANRVTVLGICMGGSHVLRAAVDEPLIRAVATVAGQYRDRAADVAWLGSEGAVEQRLARGQAAVEKYEAIGEAEYVPAIDAVRTDVGMPGELAWSWYQLWADRELWENRYALMSDAAVLSFESISAAARLTKPFLMVHSDQCAAPGAARRHFAVAPTPDKKLLWEGGIRHLQFYDDPAVIDRSVCHIVDWFARHLGTEPSGTENVDVARRFFRLLHHQDVDALGTLWHPDGVISVLYPPTGFAATISGKSEILATFRGLADTFETFRVELTGIYPAADSDAVCVEYAPHATLADGTEYTNNNIAVFRFRDGLISEYHDYFDPRRFQVVVDTLQR